MELLYTEKKATLNSEEAYNNSVSLGLFNGTSVKTLSLIMKQWRI